MSSFKSIFQIVENKKCPLYEGVHHQRQLCRRKKQETTYRIIAERKGGRFKFSDGLSPREMKAAEIGEFMKLLMDGIRRVDEDNSPEEEEV